MYVCHRADDHLPGETKEPRCHNAVRNVGRQDARDMWADYRNLERYKRVRQGVEVTARPAPGVGEAHVGAVSKSVVSGDVSLAIVCNPRVPHSQQAASTGHIDDLIQKKKVHSIAVQVASPEVKIFPKLVFEHNIPTECARTWSRVLRNSKRTWRCARKKVEIYQDYGLAYQRTGRIEEAKHAFLIAGEVCGQQWDVAVHLGGAATNYCVSLIQRISCTDARGERGSE